MDKLFNLKQWLTVPEAARRLATIFGVVNEHDVLRLALDGHLRLSVNFINHARAHPARVVPIEDAAYLELSPDFVDHLHGGKYKGMPMNMLLGMKLDDKDVLELDREVIIVEGVYDLPMIGSERLDVEHAYQGLTGGPAVTLGVLAGAFIRGQDGQLCQLLERFDENPFHDGSEAQGRILEEILNREDPPLPEASELRETFKIRRKKSLEKRRAHSESGKEHRNYFPAAGLPPDAVFVVPTNLNETDPQDGHLFAASRSENGWVARRIRSGPCPPSRPRCTGVLTTGRSNS